ncbi:helix-turn-helix domain-containing protein [uncultured Sphingomonas sp.]|uniref:helix-turn-helix domain-containing protein n=1 Tax=uncultured Sphingomonas sp. TaxID=158754 RepID=UPI0025DBB5D5|nr:helix-turn-helix domain-containing protein [uncultured Sphingomonas sp.]
MTVLTMSAAEITRFDTLMRLDRGEIPIPDAMELRGLQRRQIYRLLGRLRQEGAAGLVSRKRGRPSNRRYSDAFRAEVVALVRENYADFGPTLAREYLAERHGLGLSCETLRQIIWKPASEKTAQPGAPALISPATGATVAASWCRSTAQSIGGSRTAAHNARCWCSSTTPRAS